MSSVFSIAREDKSSSDPRFFGPEKILRPGQIDVLDLLGPYLSEQALGPGLAPSERNRLTVQSGEEINRATQGALSQLQRAGASSGIQGGARTGDISDIFEAGVLARGDVSGRLNDLSSQLKQTNLDRLLGYGTASLPFGIAQVSRGSSDNPAKSIKGGLDTVFGKNTGFRKFTGGGLF